MSKELVGDELWAIVEPLLPIPPPKPKGGRPRIADRAVLTSIFVFKSGIPWEMLPQELGCGSGMTSWRRLKMWHEAGVRARLHKVLLDSLAQAEKLNWSRANLASATLAAQLTKKGAGTSRANPTDHDKQGTKHGAFRKRHVVVDANGTPLGCVLSGANRHESQMVVPPLNAAPLVHTERRDAPRCRPHKLHADKGYDSRGCCQELREMGIMPRIVRRGVESKQPLGRYRWVIERTFAWLNRFWRIKGRYERRADIHLAFLLLGCALITWNQCQRLCQRL